VTTRPSFNGWLKVFDQAWPEPVTFHNPLQDKPFTQTIYLARNSSDFGRESSHMRNIGFLRLN
jgi:hypothetical protein